MFLIECKACPDRGPTLLGPRSIVSLHNTSDGPIAYLRCPDGHLVVTAYGNDWRAPRPAWLDEPVTTDCVACGADEAVA